MNDFDTEIMAPEEIKLNGNPSVLTPEANVYGVDKWTRHTKELEKNRNRKISEENTPITCKCNVSPHSQDSCLRECGVYY